MKVEVVKQSLASALVVCFHLCEEPRKEIDVVVCCVIGVADRAGPVLIIDDC
jgi:hypothetical protein